MTQGEITPVPRRLLSADECAERLGCSRQFLYNLRYYKVGPPAEKLKGGRLGYDPQSLEEWRVNLGKPLKDAFDWKRLEQRRRSRRKNTS